MFAAFVVPRQQIKYPRPSAHSNLLIDRSLQPTTCPKDQTVGIKSKLLCSEATEKFIPAVNVEMTARTSRSLGRAGRALDFLNDETQGR